MLAINLTLKPVLSGNLRGMLYCPLNTGCLPNKGFDGQCHTRSQIPFK